MENTRHGTSSWWICTPNHWFSIYMRTTWYVSYAQQQQHVTLVWLIRQCAKLINRYRKDRKNLVGKYIREAYCQWRCYSITDVQVVLIATSKKCLVPSPLVLQNLSLTKTKYFSPKTWVVVQYVQETGSVVLTVYCTIQVWYVPWYYVHTFICPFRIPVIPNDWRIPRFHETYG